MQTYPRSSLEVRTTQNSVYLQDGYAWCLVHWYKASNARHSTKTIGHYRTKEAAQEALENHARTQEQL